MVVICILTILILIITQQMLKKKIIQNSIAFLHPYCDYLGGGEKVLWTILLAILEKNKNQIIFIYANSKIDIDPTLKNIKQRFELDLIPYKQNIRFVRISQTYLLKSTPFLTMFCSIFQQILFGFICYFKQPCNKIIDTTGLPFCYLSFFLLGFPSSKIVSYVHYPFISNDMIQDVRKQQTKFNNSQLISKYKLLTQAKIVYYLITFYIYKMVGCLTKVAFTNSTWTNDHMKQIWGESCIKLFPPCDINSEQIVKLRNSISRQGIVSFAQFRPEKNHLQQIEIIKLLKQENINIKLTMIGSCRNQEDYDLLDQLKQQGKGLDIEFLINEPKDLIVSLMCQSILGIHTMQHEHFGIGIVEMMSCGIIVATHDSAGPKHDIIQQSGKYGYLCKSTQEFVTSIKQVLTMNEIERKEFKERSIKKAQEFSTESFKEKFLKYGTV